MTEDHYATFDGEVFRPDGPVDMEPNTRVRIIVEVESDSAAETEPREMQAEGDDPYAFLRILREANLDGPPDWSERFHYYMYGDDSRSEE